MTLILTPYVVVTAATTIVALLVAFFAWQRRQAPGGASLAALMLAAAIWAAGAACAYAAIGIPSKLFWAKIEYIGVVTCPVFYLLFAFAYNRLERWLTRRTVALLFVIPLLTLFLAFTNEWHLLIWPTVTLSQNGDNLALFGHGPGFWLGAVGYAYLLMLIATVLFFRAALRLPDLFRRQIAMIIVAALAPWVVNGIYIAGLSPVPGLELTPQVLVFSGIIFAWAMWGFQLLNVAPIARQILIDTMAEGMVVLDVQGRVVDANPAARQLLGAPPAFALGHPLAEMLPDWAYLDEHYWRRGETSAEVALAGSGARFVQMTITPLRDHRGQFIGQLVAMHDITARRGAEQALRRQNEYLKALQQTKMELVAQLDLPSLLENIVRRAGQLVGTDSGYLDLVDPRTQRLKPQVGIGILAESLEHPVEPGQGVAGMVWQTGQPRVIDDYDAWPGRVDGFTRNKLQAVVGMPLYLGAEVVGVLGVGYPAGSNRTFTPEAVEVLTQFAALAAIAIGNARLYAQVQHEKHYFEWLLEHSPAATTIIDADGRIISWNPAAEGLFGYTRAEAIGRIGDDLVAADQSIWVEARTLTAQTHAAGSVHAVTRRTCKGGALVEVELWAIPLIIDDKYVGAMAIYHDITDLQQARRVAESAARVKSEFLANMSHELRTPLNAILGFADLLAGDATLAPAQRENAALIASSGKHLLGLINDVLDMAKLEAGRATLHAAAFDLRRVVDDLVDMFRLRAAAKGLQLHLLWAEPACHIIYGDELKLRQVLINLLGNAVKFTTSGAITVGVLQIEGVGGSHLVCTVQDTGPGIAPADQATIFEPFVQAAHTSAPGEGTGLGLPISRQFARLMGGDVTVVSAGAPGQGSLFRLEIPMHCVADAGAPEQPVQPPAYGPSSSTAVQSPAASAVNAAGGARALGAGWRARVWAAAVAADAPALQLLAAQLAAEQPAIATQLSGWTAAYDYDAIKRAMEETT